MDLFIELLSVLTKDANPSHVIENLFLMFVLWRTVRPHLNKVEARMDSIASELNRINHSVVDGFKAGNERFSEIESRLDRANIPK
jgi:hypothetical protein